MVLSIDEVVLSILVAIISSIITILITYYIQKKMLREKYSFQLKAKNYTKLLNLFYEKMESIGLIKMAINNNNYQSAQHYSQGILGIYIDLYQFLPFIIRFSSKEVQELLQDKQIKIQENIDLLLNYLKKRDKVKSLNILLQIEQQLIKQTNNLALKINKDLGLKL